MKAIYTKIGNTYYQVDQDMKTPVNISRMESTHTSTYCNCNDEVGVDIWVETMNCRTPTNKKSVEILLQFLKDNMITQIDTLKNTYKAYMDYSILDENGREMEHSVSIVAIEGIDSIRPLGVDKENECVYRQVKTVSPKFNMILKNPVPFGIMQARKGTCSLSINDILILQEFAQSDDIPSMYNNCYKYGSNTIMSTLENMVTIFSTKNEGILLSPIDLPKIPRKINVYIELSLANYTVVYDNHDIIKILEENYQAKKDKIPPESEDEIIIDNTGCGCGCMKPDEEVTENPSDTNKDDEESTDNRVEDNSELTGLPDFVYERCSAQDAQRLEVVEDLIPDEDFYEEYMVRKKDVLPSIPTIEVGDFVVLVTEKDFIEEE